MGIKIKNVMEELVIHKLELVLPSLDCCKCRQCRAYLLTETLNKLPPIYVSNHTDYLLAKSNMLNLQFDLDILMAITKTAKELKETPHHIYFLYNSKDA